MGGTVCDLGVAARAIQNDSILLVKEGKGAYVNQWGLPKGRVDPGENLESAVLRELHEETGAGGSIIGLAAVRSTMFKDKPAVFLCFDVHLETPAEELLRLLILPKVISPVEGLYAPSCCGKLVSLTLPDNISDGKILLKDSFTLCLELSKSKADAFNASLFASAI